jgi:hypothetical protein
MALKVLNTDDEVTKELKEAVIKVFVAAGIVLPACTGAQRMHSLII